MGVKISLFLLCHIFTFNSSLYICVLNQRLLCICWKHLILLYCHVKHRNHFHHLNLSLCTELNSCCSVLQQPLSIHNVISMYYLIVSMTFHCWVCFDIVPHCFVVHNHWNSSRFTFSRGIHWLKYGICINVDFTQWMGYLSYIIDTKALLGVDLFLLEFSSYTTNHLFF